MKCHTLVLTILALGCADPKNDTPTTTTPSTTSSTETETETETTTSSVTTTTTTTTTTTPQNVLTVCTGPNDYATIQAAVDDAVQGDIIEVCAGDWDRVDITRVDLTLVGIDGAELTRIYTGTGPAILVEGRRLEISGFTLSSDSNGGAAALSSQYGAVYLHDAIVADVDALGVALVFTYSDVAIERVIFERNEYQALFALSAGNLLQTFAIRNSIFRQNPGNGVRGKLIETPISTANFDFEMTNCEIYTNQSPYPGSSLITLGSGAKIWNNTFFDNIAPRAIVESIGGSILNNLFVENDSKPMLAVTGEADYSFSLYNSYNSNLGGGMGVHDFGGSDPMLVDPYNGDFGLLAGSPLVDRGDPDPAFNDTNGTRNDIGSTGGPARPVVWAPIDPILPPAGTQPTVAADIQVCVSGGAAHTDIQAAIDVASPGDVIGVCPGVYPSIVVDDKTLSFVTSGGVDVTTIDGKGKTAVHILGTNANVTLSGFTLTGSADFETAFLRVEDGTVQITDTTFSDYHPPSSGDIGVHVSGGNVLLDRVVFEDNTTQSSMIYASEGQITVQHAVFRRNGLGPASGPMIQFLTDAIGQLTNSLIYDNVFSYHMLKLRGPSLSEIANITVYGNEAIWMADVGNDAVMKNSILLGNTSNVFTGETDALVAYNNLFGNGVTSYSANITAIAPVMGDPMLTDPANGDFTLMAGSPMIDAGNPDASDSDTDGTRNDLGAFGGPGGNWTP